MLIYRSRRMVGRSTVIDTKHLMRGTVILTQPLSRRENRLARKTVSSLFTGERTAVSRMDQLCTTCLVFQFYYSSDGRLRFFHSEDSRDCSRRWLKHPMKLRAWKVLHDRSLPGFELLIRRVACQFIVNVRLVRLRHISKCVFHDCTLSPHLGHYLFLFAKITRSFSKIIALRSWSSVVLLPVKYGKYVLSATRHEIRCDHLGERPYYGNMRKRDLRLCNLLYNTFNKRPRYICARVV